MAEDRRYSDFDLLIESVGEESYRARVVDSPVGEASGAFSIPFSELELENFLLKVGRPRRGTRRLESPEMEAARDFGSQLFNSVFQDDLRLALRRSLDEAERRDEGLRIRLRFSDTPELASLPWEFLFNESSDQFLVLSTWTPIIRYLDLTQRIEPLTVDGPLRILAMISSPHDYPTLDVEEEWRRVESGLAPLIESGAVVIDRAENATLLELQRRLRKTDYHIFHFLGHGGFNEQADDGVLVLEDGNNRSRVVAGRDLGTILHDHRSLRLAVLNACEGARAGSSDPFSGTAQSLVRQGIPAVVAMQFEITDDAAIAFAHEFYGAIADAYPVDAAIGEARRAIFGLGNDIEWGTPVVYLRGDGRLFDVQQAAATSAPAAVVAASAVAAEPEDIAVKEPPAAEPPVEQEPAGEPPAEDEQEADTAEPVAAAVVVSEGAADTAGEEITEEPPVPKGEATEDRPASGVLAALLALPMWAMWAVIGAGVLVVIVLAVMVFSGDGEGDLTDGTEVTATTTGTTLATETTPAAALDEVLLTDDGMAVARRSEQPKLIDASDEDWPDFGLHTTEHITFISPPIRNGEVARAGEENSSLIRLAWDSEYLYVFAEVVDDIHSAPNEGNQIWRNDAVNLNVTVGPTGNAASAKPDEDDHQLTLSPGDPEAGTTEASLRFVGNGNGFSDNFTDIADVSAEVNPGVLYVLEARIPWSEIGVSDPQGGDQFGLLLTVFDNDGEQFEGQWLQAEIKANTPPPGPERDSRWFQGPQSWGTLTLDG